MVFRILRSHSRGLRYLAATVEANLREHADAEDMLCGMVTQCNSQQATTASKHTPRWPSLKQTYSGSPWLSPQEPPPGQALFPISLWGRGPPSHVSTGDSVSGACLPRSPMWLVQSQIPTLHHRNLKANAVVGATGVHPSSRNPSFPPLAVGGMRLSRDGA